MKILLSTYYNQRFPAMNEHVEATLRKMGHVVDVFEHYKFRLPGRIRQRMPRLQNMDRRRLNRALLWKVDAVQPDLVLVLGGMTIEPETIARIRRKSILTANWFSDYPSHFAYTMAIAPSYDYFFVSDSLSRDRHRAAGHRNVHWLPFGCLPEWAEAEGLRDDRAAGNGQAGRDGGDIVFVGSYYPERMRCLSALRGASLAVCGPGWTKEARLHLPGAAMTGDALGVAGWQRLYRQTPIALNIHYGCGGESDAYGAMANTRVFEVLASGGFLLTDEKRDVLTLLTAGRDFAGYHDPAECAKQVQYYLNHEDERRMIARHGQQTVLSCHTYRHRLEECFDVMRSGVPVSVKSAEPGKGQGVQGASTTPRQEATSQKQEPV